MLMLNQEYWKTIEEKDAALALIHDDLQNRQSQIQAIQ